MKTRILAACLGLCLLCSGCAAAPDFSETESLPAGPFADGVYEVRLLDYEDSWKEYLSVLVENGYITKTEYDAKNSENEQKTKNTALRDEMMRWSIENGFAALYPEAIYKSLTDDFVQGEFDPGEVELVAGATKSSENFKILAQRLRQLLDEQKTGTFSASPYREGSYLVRMPEKMNGYYMFLQLDIDAEGVESILFGGVDENGQLWDENYFKGMNDANAVAGLPQVEEAEVQAQLVQSFRESELVDGVELVAGATVSSKTFKRLLRSALATAKTGETPMQWTQQNKMQGDPLPLFADGEYTTFMQTADENGWREFVSIQIEEGAIVSIVFDAANEAGGYKSQDEQYKDQVISGGLELVPEKMYTEIIQSYIAAGYVAAEMELVAGATTSLSQFQSLVTAALEHALYGEVGVSYVE